MSDDEARQQTQPARIPEPRDRPDTGGGTEPAGDEPAVTDATPQEATGGEADTASEPDLRSRATESDDFDDADDADADADDDRDRPAADEHLGGDDADDPDNERVEGADPAGPAPEETPQRGRRRAAGLRASVLIGVLFALLGFGLAVQVRTNSATSGLNSARQEDLVRILDDLSSREDRLRQQISSLESARSKLLTSGDKASVALSEAKNRSATLGILAGTVPARGPGVRVTINDPGHKLNAEDLLDAVQELRAAGAEAFQVGPVRIGVSSAFTDEHGSVLADGVRLDPPYVILAIGDPATLATALNIPGGVVASVRNAGGQAVVEQQQHLVIDALRPVHAPDYASPAPTGGN